jgi:glycosyltransferase involved in cell wall biosynthesis
MNHGVSVIATDVPGCRDLIENEVNGILIPPRNTIELFRAMEKVTQMNFEKKSLKVYSKEVIYPLMEKTYQSNVAPLD